MAKEKMPIEKKAKLIYSGELLFISIVFIVISILVLLKILGNKMLVVYNWVTIFGGAFMIGDFIWLMCSPRRRKRNCIIDKALLVPMGIYLITFDILCFCKVSAIVDTYLRRVMMAIGFFYLAAVYIFQAIYHWFKPVPGFLDDLEEKEEPVEPEGPQLENKDVIENAVEEKEPEE